MSQQQIDELCDFQEEKGLMVNAIKVLARVTITQTKKYLLYRRKYRMAKSAVIQESDQTKIAQQETDVAQSRYYDARAQYLKEKDIREELSEEVQYLAKKNNILRYEQKEELEARQAIINDIIDTWDEYSYPNQLVGSNFTIKNAHSVNEGESTHEKESTRIKELETMVFQLTLQLKQRDDHLKFIKHHLEEK